MRYRKGYYRKDGTYVQGHYVNDRSKKGRGSGKNAGCLALLVPGLLALWGVIRVMW